MYRIIPRKGKRAGGTLPAPPEIPPPPPPPPPPKPKTLGEVLRQLQDEVPEEEEWF